MNILDYQHIFGAGDVTTAAMREALQSWFSLYYGVAQEGEDPCQRIAYTLVSKLTRRIFGEYRATAKEPATNQLLQALDKVKSRAMQLALTGGVCFLKPNPVAEGFHFSLIPRDQILIFARDSHGNATDVGTVQQVTGGRFTYTLLERRKVDSAGFLTVENKLFQSTTPRSLGQQVPLSACKEFSRLPKNYTYPSPVGSVGLVALTTPMINCVDGSADPVSLYAAATGLIHSIDLNEKQLSDEFLNGKSRILVSKDLLDGASGLTDRVFVGLDEDPERIGISIFSPQLREQSYLARKQEYLRNIESVIGLKRGLLSDANLDDRTATEIAASEQEQNLTAMDFQRMWEQALQECVCLCRILSKMYRLPEPKENPVVDWGNGVVCDEEKTWADYLEMVKAGLLKPEVALGWRFNLPAETDQQQAIIRARFMP